MARNDRRAHLPAFHLTVYVSALGATGEAPGPFGRRITANASGGELADPGRHAWEVACQEYGLRLSSWPPEVLTPDGLGLPLDVAPGTYSFGGVVHGPPFELRGVWSRREQQKVRCGECGHVRVETNWTPVIVEVP